MAGEGTGSMTEKHDVVALTAEIVAAYVGNNSVASDDIAELIGKVHRALVAVATGAVVGPVPERMDQKPAVPVKRSVHSDFSWRCADAAITAFDRSRIGVVER